MPPKLELPSFAPELRVTPCLRRVRVAGVDEVGRGPLAGPVMAAAVRLDPDAVPPGLNDSKKLRPAARAALAAQIAACAEVGLGTASVEEIDRLNILRASHLAMLRAIAAMPTPAERLLIDGHLLPDDLPCPAVAVVKGDARSLSIAAASIVAKVARDRIMKEAARIHPGYGWETNAGYPTAAHLVALKTRGVTPYHRRSFAPVHKILCGEQNTAEP